MSRLLRLSPVAALALLTACTSKDGQDDTGSTVTPRDYADCNPLSSGYCTLPYPSMFYMREDSTASTGWRVHLGETTLPDNKFGQQPAPTYWNELDGFSPMGPFLVQFPDLALDGLAGHENIGDSLLPDSKSIVVDMETGELVPHWSELDVSGPYVEGQEDLIIRPAVALKNGHRYAVALRGLVDTSGNPEAPSAGYLAIRDGTPTDNWDIEGQRADYDLVFAALEGAGWSRADTQISFDFVVGSTDKITGRATAIIADALATVGAGGPAYTIDEVDDEFNESIYRRVLGHMTVPLYTEEDAPGTLLTRDDAGMPYQNGTTTVPFTILIPRTAAEDPRPLPMLQYGHGLLGSQDEVESGYLGEMANTYGFILFAVDWTGMKSDDANAIELMIAQDLGQFAMIPERMHQGYVEFACAAAMMKGDMAADDVMKLPSPTDGAPVAVADPATLYYYGNSQGGIYGGTYMALSPTIERGVLGVPGMPYSLLLSRSADFSAFFMLFQAVYPEQQDISFWMVAMQNLWDSAEPGGYARQMTEEPLYGTPKQILIQDALGDAQVSNLGAQNMARAYGAVQVGTPVREIYGVDTVASGYTGNAIQEADFGAPAVPSTNIPPGTDTDTHEDARRNPPMQHQLWTFLTTGTVVDYCDGVCDPE